MTIDEIEILLVEDNPDDVELTLRALKKHNLTNKVHVARDGEEALAYFFADESPEALKRNHIPKVILLDLKLPKVDGIEVLRRLKASERTKKIPVVVLTSSNQERDLKDCYDLGANSYITKPVAFDGFIKAVKEIGFYWLLLNQPPEPTE